MTTKDDKAAKKASKPAGKKSTAKKKAKADVRVPLPPKKKKVAKEFAVNVSDKLEAMVVDRFKELAKSPISLRMTQEQLVAVWWALAIALTVNKNKNQRVTLFSSNAISDMMHERMERLEEMLKRHVSKMLAMKGLPRYNKVKLRDK